MSNNLTYREYFEKETGLRAPHELSVGLVFANACQCYTCSERCTQCWGERNSTFTLYPDYKERVKERSPFYEFRPAVPDSTYKKYFEKITGLKAPIRMPITEIFSDAWNFCTHCSFNNNFLLCRGCWEGCGDGKHSLVPDYQELMRKFRTSEYCYSINCYGNRQPEPSPYVYRFGRHRGVTYIDDYNKIPPEFDLTLLAAE